MLEVQSLSVAYGSKIVLTDVSLSVSPGEVLSLIGPNGSGKSTLIRSISGVLPARTGRILMDGQDIVRLPARERARFISVVPQARDLPDNFSVYQTVLLGRTPYQDWMGRSNADDHQRVMEALQQTSMEELAERPVGELSGGEQQRVLLARALVQDTPVLLLDEPTTFLDIQHQSSLLNLVRRLATEKRIAVLMAMHDLNLAGLYSDRVALLVGGRILSQGAPGEVLTEQNLQSVYNIPVHVIAHPDYGSPLVLPDGLYMPPERHGTRPVV
ncbi:MAG: heme ABC transporter ATP-binding protein [Chloroflexi bacterium]|jgi:iron complex transport system ATP-binding protein|nr:heme ABC transporter ATP-binding protein [Chloroflexota bacterium]